MYNNNNKNLNITTYFSRRANIVSSPLPDDKQMWRVHELSLPVVAIEMFITLHLCQYTIF